MLAVTGFGQGDYVMRMFLNWIDDVGDFKTLILILINAIKKWDCQQDYVCGDKKQEG